MLGEGEDTNRGAEIVRTLEERKEEKKKKPAILIGVGSGVVIAIVVGWMTIGRYVSLYSDGEGGSLPIIRADRSIDGMKPDSPGGMYVPDRDKMVYERLRRSNTELPVERLLPLPEKPAFPDQDKVTDKNPEPVSEAKKNQIPPQDEIAALAEKVIMEEEVASATIYDDDGSKIEVMFKTADEAVAKPEFIKSEKPVKKAEKKKELVPPVVIKQPETPKFSIQLVSARSEKAAESEWTRLSKKHKEILGALPHTVSETKSEKGAFYRLRVGSFKTREEAKSVCDSLKQKKQECFIVQ